MTLAHVQHCKAHWGPVGAALRWAVLAMVVVLQACATVTNPDARDPLESWNRGVFGFNEAADRAVLKPVATVYRDATPNVVQKGVKNFLNNLEDVWSAFNTAIQFRGNTEFDITAEFIINVANRSAAQQYLALPRRRSPPARRPSR